MRHRLMPRELLGPTEPPIGAKVRIMGGHISSTYQDGPYERIPNGIKDAHGGSWRKEGEQGDVDEVITWHALLVRWLRVHPYERAQLVVVDEGPQALDCPACHNPLIAHSVADQHRCLTELATRSTT